MLRVSPHGIAPQVKILGWITSDRVGQGACIWEGLLLMPKHGSDGVECHYGSFAPRCKHVNHGWESIYFFFLAFFFFTPPPWTGCVGRDDSPAFKDVPWSAGAGIEDVEGLGRLRFCIFLMRVRFRASNRLR